MKRFRHVNARSVEEAISILREYPGQASLIAGGTDLVGQLRDEILANGPEIVINIKTVPGMDGISEEGEILKIGALTRLEDIARDETVREKYALLAETARRTASPHIREMGTIGGNICQSNRCWYYWVPGNRFCCLRKGGKHCYALAGDARYHSVFGSTRINGTPCSNGCPDNINIADYMSKIREGDMAGAARILLKDNPLPAVTGRVCPHYCEKECSRGVFDEAVSIRCVERALGDYILDNSPEMYRSPTRELGKSVAVVGSGPSGLAAAYYLRQAGYRVTVYESMERPGGMLAYGIPPYRLPREVVTRQVEALEGIGIRFKLNTAVGGDIGVGGLSRDHDAVYIATGAWKETPAGIEGEELFRSGAEFLRDKNKDGWEGVGRKAAVIGGGNVAIDVARTLLRTGNKPVVVYRRGREEMPAFGEEVARAQEEGVEFMFLTQPVKAAGKSGKIILKSVKMRLGPVDESGRPRPLPVEGSEFEAEFDAVFAATGERPDLSILPDEFVSEGRLKIDPATGSLGKNVFAGGDLVTGPATVVEAIAAGRKAAGSIDRFLGGGVGERDDESCGQHKSFNIDYARKTKRARAPQLPAAERVKGLDIEETGGLEPSAVGVEANRCFNCGCAAVNPSDMAPALIVMKAKIVTSKRTIEAEDFFEAGVDKSTVLDADEIVIRIDIPAPSPASRTKFIKFALRKTIDFPVVNCAAAIERENGVVKSARICLNSVYNRPYRVTGAEEFITGKAITRDLAEEAAGVIFRDALPLVNNKYKVHVARALVKRAILACGPSDTGT